MTGRRLLEEQKDQVRLLMKAAERLGYQEGIARIRERSELKKVLFRKRK
jgi:hypothetical protein